MDHPGTPSDRIAKCVPRTKRDRFATVAATQGCQDCGGFVKVVQAAVPELAADMRRGEAVVLTGARSSRRVRSSRLADTICDPRDRKNLAQCPMIV